MYSNKISLNLCFFLLLTSFFYANSELKKVADYIYEDESGAILIYEKPVFTGKAGLVGKVSSAITAASFAGMAFMIQFGLGGNCRDCWGTSVLLSLYALIQVTGFTGLFLSTDTFIKFIKRKIWGHMVALGNKGFFHWNHGFISWNDIEDISFKEEISYYVDTDRTEVPGNSNLYVTSEELRKRITHWLILKLKDDLSDESSFINKKENSNFIYINLKNFPISVLSLVDKVKMSWNNNKSH